MNDFLIADTSGGTWVLGATDIGQLKITPAAGATQIVFIADQNNKPWQVNISNGYPTLNPVAGIPNQVNLQSPNGAIWQLLAYSINFYEAYFLVAPNEPFFVPLPFSQRATTAVAVFPCIGIASPAGAPMLTTSVPSLVALQLCYAQLLSVYRTLIHQDTVNSYVQLQIEVITALSAVKNLSAALQQMTVSIPDLRVQLGTMRTIAANAVMQIFKVYSDQFFSNFEGK